MGEVPNWQEDMSDIAHGKKITTESYYEGSIASIKQEYEVSIITTKESLLKDVIDALNVITKSETHKLDVCIIVDKLGRYRLVKRWLVD